jgi:single-strand DNA-binding protein
MYLNKVELIGFIGSDAETKTTPQGKAVTLNRQHDVLAGERQSRSQWHRMEVWGKLGQYAAALKKGAHVCVEGELRSREYESNGAKVRTYDIVVSSIINLRAGQRNAAPPEPAMSFTPRHYL